LLACAFGARSIKVFQSQSRQRVRVLQTQATLGASWWGFLLWS
jgi:hypothetical protein